MTPANYAELLILREIVRSINIRSRGRDQYNDYYEVDRAAIDALAVAIVARPPAQEADRA